MRISLQKRLFLALFAPLLAPLFALGAPMAAQAMPEAAEMPVATPVLLTGPDAGWAPGQVATPTGTLAELSSVRLPGPAPERREATHAVRTSRAATPPHGEEASPSQPAPAGGLGLTIGLAVLAYIARRKLSLLGG
jgi:hypothetical protein